MKNPRRCKCYTYNVLKNAKILIGFLFFSEKSLIFLNLFLATSSLWYTGNGRVIHTVVVALGLPRQVFSGVRVLGLLDATGHVGAEGGREGTLGSDLVSVEVEEHGNGHQEGGDTAQEGGGPLDADSVEQVGGEERKAGTEERTQECVGGDGRGGTVMTRISIYL